MKVRCITTCYHSKSCRQYQQGNIYDIDDKNLKPMLEQDMGKFFTTEDGKPLPSAPKKEK